MSFREKVELIEVLAKTHQHEEALLVYREVYSEITDRVIRYALNSAHLIEIPGEAYMDLYLGQSRQLNAFKIGISMDAAQRELSIRSTNARHGNGGDYEMLYSVRGPALAVRDCERRVKDDYAHMTVMGKEWISFVAKDVPDAYFSAQDEVLDAWEEQLRTYDALKAHDRSTAALRSVGLGGSAVVELAELDKKSGEWLKVYHRVMNTQVDL